VTVAIFRTLDDATADAYVLRSVIDGDATVGGVQACMAADNRISRRPSPLANPPYSEASIQQRDRLLRALGAYEVAMSSIAAGAPEAGLASANFQRAAFALGTVANVHTQGDLFIDQDAAGLTSLAARLRDAPDEASRQTLAKRADPLISKLIGILRDDVAKRRLEALVATRREIDLRLTYAALVASRATRPEHHAVLPRCSSPTVPVLQPTTAQTAAAPSSASATDQTSVGQARARAAALESVSLDAFFEVLLDLSRSAVSPSIGVDAALQRLRAAVPPQARYLPLLGAPT